LSLWVVYFIEGFKTGVILASKTGFVTGGKDLENQQIWVANSSSRMYTLTPHSEQLQIRFLIPDPDQTWRRAWSSRPPLAQQYQRKRKNITL